MSTRCNIGFYVADADPIKKFEALLYKHSDGLPRWSVTRVSSIC